MIIAMAESETFKYTKVEAYPRFPHVVTHISDISYIPHINLFL